MSAITSAVRTVLPSPILRALRGHQNSVVQRFFIDPRERASLFLNSLYGRSYLDWYASRMDRYTGRTGEELAESEYLRTGHDDLDILVQFGMKPHHSLYEFGTGQARSSQHFIRYLETERFFGNDASAGRVTEALNLLSLHGLMEKKPTLFVSKSNDFSWIGTEQKFDFFWCNAVFCHMPENDICETLTNLRRIMKPSGVVLMSDTHIDNSTSVVRHTVKDWFRPAEWYCEIGREAGFMAEDVSGHLHDGSYKSYRKNKEVDVDGNLTISSHLVKLMPTA